jgi:hypothetical protein
MQQSSFQSVLELGTSRQRSSPRENFRLHAGRLAAVEKRPVAEPSPLHSVQTLATTMFVMSVAVGWIAVASLATAPLIGAGELLSRAARSSH